MSYRKQISYLELQENGQRIRGAGYAKLESWEEEEILMVQLRGQGIVSGKEMMLLYLQRESGEELLCEMTAERGTISCEKRISRKADWEPTLGIRIPLERNFEIIGRFAGAAGAKKVPAPVTAIAPVTVGEIEGQGQGGNQPEQEKRPIQTEQQEAQNREMQRERVQELYGLEYSDESIAIVALLHDLCKIGCYKKGTRNVKDESGKWQTVPTYTFDDPLPYGHGEKSVYIANGYIRLNREEAMAIRWHMGFSGPEDNRTVGQALQRYPLAFALAMADMEASYFLENEDRL